MSCINPNNPAFQTILRRVGNPLLAEVEFTKLTNEDFVIQNGGTFVNVPEEERQKIYENYINLMDRKREGKGITYEKFNDMFDSLQVFKHKQTYIFGEWDVLNNIFKARLISAPSIREMFNSMDVLMANADMMASVPDDIGAMLEKKGLYKLNVGKQYNFRGEDMIKNLYFSSKETAEKAFNKPVERITTQDIIKYDTFFNYWSLIGKLQQAYENKEFDNLYGLLEELGIYDYNAYKLQKRLKIDAAEQERQNIIIEKSPKLKARLERKREEERKQIEATGEKYVEPEKKYVKDTVEQIIKNSANNKVVINRTDILNNPEIYNQLDTELNKELAMYLSKFGIKTEVVQDIQDKLGIDSLAYVDILNKIVYVNKNNQQDYPQQAGKLIAYMMQHNPLVAEITSAMKKSSIFNNLTNDELFEAMGDLISRELHSKTDTEMPKSLIEAIRNLIRQFFNFLDSIKLKRINKNIAFIADNVLLQNQALITSSVFKPGTIKPVSKIGLEEALKSDPFGNSIVEKMSEYFILTGSITLSEQGTVYRPNENQMHDIDWVSALSTEESKRIFNELYPDNIFIRNITNDDYQTNTWLIAPEGYTIKNLKLFGSTNKITGYDIVDAKGNIVSSYIPKKDSHTNPEVEAKLIDIFTYPKITEDNVRSSERTLNSGTKLRIATWQNTFNAKLQFGRLKDIWDYNRFIPNENIFNPESKLNDAVIDVNSAEISNFYNELSQQEKDILGNLDDLIAAYEDAPFNQDVEDYIDTLKCKL